MSAESLAWFAGQAVGIGFAGATGWRVARLPERMWKLAAVAATLLMLAWPLMRVFPSHVLSWFGPRVVAFVEVTGITLPAVALFAIAGRRSRTASQRRAVLLLIPVCCLYFVHHGGWMVRPAVTNLGPTEFKGDVCLQSTGYTCVAASLVTLLRAYGYEATETEMARLTYTEVNGGATDSRAVWGLRQRLRGEPIEVCYEKMDYERLKSVPKPCVVPIRWGYFISHMVPVLSASDQEVRLGDPLDGPRTQRPSEFQAVWKGTGIFLVDRRP